MGIKRKNPNGKKVCKKCHVEKDEGLFSLNKSTIDGFSRYCKTCCAEARKSRNSKSPKKNGGLNSRCEKCNKPIRSRSRHCAECYKTLPRAPRKRGSRHQEKAGYIRIYLPEHPRADKNGRVLEHVLVMEAHLGRYLIWPGETVHHKDGNRENNVLTNLELWVIKHPAGQRAEDLVKYAREILELYGDLF